MADGRAISPRGTAAAASSDSSRESASSTDEAVRSLVQTDEQLIARLRRGETAAGEVLVDRYHEPLVRYLSRQAGSAHVAEELLQQTWLSVFEHLDQFKYDEQGGMGFKAWVFRIATNKAHDLWRSRGREKTAYAGLKLVTDEVVADASQRLSGSEQEARLRRAIERLPEPQKQVVMLRYYGDLKFVEIAQTLGCPLNTALGRMHKAMLKLKKSMEDEPDARRD